MQMTFENKVVAITGAAGNLGRAAAMAFAEAGANLALFDVSVDGLERVYGADDASRKLVAVDLLDSDSVETAVAGVTDAFGAIDVLCNIAGGFDMGPPVHETPGEMWRKMNDMNVRTLVHMCRAVVPGMIEAGGGKIVNIGAAAALSGLPNMGAYLASKSTVIRLTESMSAELRDQGINVNCVLPSIIDTPQNRAAMPDADPSRWVTPEALADAIMFLSSEKARAVHGAALPVTGLG
jgi:NAD(P)-dependent dehydrogenase (short-subunit alcohol dehydrogenase family)